MARRRGRGGYQRPNNPAAVSGPGSLSQRTDGGPSPDFQGLPYGENAAVNDQAAAAPVAGRGQGGGGGGAPAPGQPRRPVFGATERPGEAMTAGVDFGPGAGAAPGEAMPNDANRLIRAIIAEHPQLAEQLIHLVEG